MRLLNVEDGTAPDRVLPVRPEQRKISLTIAILRQRQ